MRKFTALYTHQKLKKAKTWQDGFAHYNSEAKEIVVFDASNARIASHRLRAKETIELSIEYDVGRYLLTLEEEHSSDAVDGADDCESGIVSSNAKPVLARGKQPLVSGISKRPRRPASLIKPIKLKSKGGSEPGHNITAIESSKGDVIKPNVEPQNDVKEVCQETMEYTVLYTTQKTKKAKTWSDGTLLLHEADHRIVLRDDSGGTLTSVRLPRSKPIEVGGEIDHGTYLIQIECLKGNENIGASLDSDEPVLQLQGRLKRRHNALLAESADQPSKPTLARKGLQKIKLLKRVSSVSSASDLEPIGDATTVSTAPLTDNSVIQERRIVPKRASFVPPESQVPSYLHFPKRGELLQHVSISKGYGFGPPRKLLAPVAFAEWSVYQKKLSELLRENLMAELSALAIRYFFMAHEKYEGSKQLADANASSSKTVQKRKPQWKRGGYAFGSGGKGPSLVQACKSVGVLYFDDCTIRQPFMDSVSFKAQLGKGSVSFSKGDSIVIELNRRELYAGYAKDDTWAISTSEDFATETTFLARSVFFGPSKNNSLELKLVGNDDAKAASRLFNRSGENSGSKKRMSAAEKAVSGIVAVRCLDSASDWSMIDSVEECLSPESLPVLPHLLRMPIDCKEPPPSLSSDEVISKEEVLDRIAVILNEKREEFTLNENQFHILNRVVMSAVSIYIPVEDTSPITVVHGPFGTGKSFIVSVITITLDEIASEFPSIFNRLTMADPGSRFDEYTTEPSASQEHSSGGPAPPGTAAAPQTPPLRVLVSSMTNFAVDNMLAALLKQGYDQFLRVGNLKRISKQILPYVCRSSSSATEDIKELESMLEVAGNESEHDAICTAIQKLRQQRSQEVIDNTFVIGTTCLSAATAALQSASFPLVILDEACQIVEPMALIALVNARCQRLVLVGDPLQLPPTLTTRATKDAEGKGLDRALFDRLVEMGHQPQFLSTQYRCHPRIGSLCSQLFYGGRLLHGISPDDRPPLVPGIPPLSFLDTAGQEKQQGKSQSFFNKGEIDMAVQLARRFIHGGVPPESIGIIALYKTQADMLQEQLTAFLGERSRVQVSTVDAYQGSEREVIIVSCVRTNKIGFISNPNRINVALSRARTHCAILGCRRLLETNAMWRKIIEYCREDVSGLGSVSAQTFLNRLAASAAEHGIERQISDMLETDIPDPQNSTNQTVNKNENELESDDEDEDEDSTNLRDDYPDEGVVGGLLSQQWSLPSLGFIDQPDDIATDVDDDLIDCLDVDLDEM